MSQHQFSPRARPRFEDRAVAIHVATVRGLSMVLLALGGLGVLCGGIALAMHQVAAVGGATSGTVLVGAIGAVGLGLHPRDLARGELPLRDSEIVELIGRCCVMLLAAAVVGTLLHVAGL